MAPINNFAGLTVSEQAARMTVMHPAELTPLVNKETGEECWIELLPSQGERGAVLDRQMTDRALRRRVQRLTSKDVEKNGIDKLVGLTTAWSLAELDGTPLNAPCTPEMAEMLYTKVRWLRDQVATWVADLGNFQATSSPSLSTSLSTALSSTS